MESLLLLLLLLVVFCVANVGAHFTQTNEIPSGLRDEKRHEMHHQNSVESFFVEELACHVVTTPYGCCWDGRTIATGPNGQGCPVCRDRKRRHCRKWRNRCPTDELIRKICPRTCQRCQRAKSRMPRINDYYCRDEHLLKDQCKMYKELQLCYISSIKDRCRKSCDNCW